MDGTAMGPRRDNHLDGTASAKRRLRRKGDRAVHDMEVHESPPRARRRHSRPPSDGTQAVHERDTDQNSDGSWVKNCSDVSEVSIGSSCEDDVLEARSDVPNNNACNTGEKYLCEYRDEDGNIRPEHKAAASGL